MASPSGDGSDKSRTREVDGCSLLVKNLPSQWFHSSENSKINLLKASNGQVERISCSSPESGSAIVRMCKDQAAGGLPGISCQGASSSVIVQEKSSTMITLSDSRFSDLLTATAQNLNIKYRSKSETEFIFFGSLDRLVNFRNVFEKEILISCGLNPRPRGEHSAEIDDSLRAITSSTTGSTTSRKDIELIVNQVDPDILIIMKTVKDGKIPGIEYDISSGSVFIQKKLRNTKSKERFHRFYNELSREKIKANTYHIPIVLSLASVQDDLNAFLRKHDRCGVHVKEDTREVRLASYSSRQYDSIAKQLSDIFDFPSFVFPNGRVLSLLKKDITKEHVDIIVNAANGHLSHIGGIAAAINKASSGAVQRFSDFYMQQRGHREIPVGDIAVTGAEGNLHCQHIIHAVGPANHHNDCSGAMNYLIKRVLYEAEKLDAKSIAIPAISTGIFNVSKDVVATAIFSTILSYDFKKDRPVLDDIRIVIVDNPTYQNFLKHFNRMKEEKNHSRVSETPCTPDGKAPHTSKSSSSEEFRRSESMPTRGAKDDDTRERGKDKGKGCGGGRNDRRGGGGKKFGNEGSRAKGGHCGDDGSSDNTSKSSKFDRSKSHEGPDASDSDLHKACGHDRDSGSTASKDSKCDKKEEEKKDDCDDKATADGAGHAAGTESPDISPEEGAVLDNTLLPSSGTTNLSTPKNDPSRNSTENSEKTTSNSAVGPSGVPAAGKPPGFPSSSVYVSSSPGCGHEHQMNNPPPGLTHPSKTGAPGSAVLNPNAQEFTLGRVSCSTCDSGTDVARVFPCEHYFCQSCINVMNSYYCFCPICIPSLSKFKKLHLVGAALQEHVVAGPDQNYYLLKYCIPEQFGPNGTLIIAEREINTFVPHTQEGKEVVELFKQAFLNDLMFFYGGSQTGFARLLFTHSFFKIFYEGGGRWGYPDDHYLAKVKTFLRTSLVLP